MRLINSDDVIKAIDKHTFDTDDGLCLDDDITCILEDMPTIEPERKTGKWIVFSSPDEYHCGLVKCPFCSEELIAEANEYNYCPNCGADMRGEQP